MAVRATTLRTTALLAACAFAVHQLRYLLSFGAGSSQHLAQQGHSYMTTVAPILAALLTLALIHLGLRVARPAIGRPASLPGAWRMWGLASGALLGLYVLQESAEGMFAAGHPTGLEGLFGHGGWAVLVLVVVFGALVAFVLRGAAALERSADRRRPAASGRPASVLPALLSHVLPAPDPLSTHLAGRGPPPIVAAM